MVGHSPLLSISYFRRGILLCRISSICEQTLVADRTPNRGGKIESISLNPIGRTGDGEGIWRLGRLQI